MGDPLPVRVAGPRTVVRHCPSTRIPLPSHAAAAACLSTSGPPAVRHPSRRALSVFPDTTGIAPSPARHVAPRPGSRHAGSCPAGAGSLPRLGGLPWPSVVRLHPRATAHVAYGALRCVVDRLCCCVAARHWRSSRAAFTRRALRPGNVASGDRCVRGTLAPRHHAGTNSLLSKALGATGPKADLAPRHYRIPPPGDMPRKAPSAASGRRPVVTRRCASDRAPDEGHHGAEHRHVGAGHSMSGRPEFATRTTLRSLSTPISRTRVARPEPSARTATIQPRAAGSSGPTYAKSPAAASGASAPWPANSSTSRAAGGDRGRDDAIAACARPAEVRCVAAMPTNQLRTSFAPMTSTRRVPWPPLAGLRHRNRSR